MTTRSSIALASLAIALGGAGVAGVATGASHWSGVDVTTIRSLWIGEL
jgi:hypothetical protein